MEDEIRKEILNAAKEGRIVEYYYKTDDKELILEAMEINPKSILNASDELLANDKELALKALEYDLSVYIILNYGLQRDKEIIEKMLSCAIEEMDYILKLEGKEKEEEERKFNSRMSMVATQFYEYEYQYEYPNIIDNREHAIMLMRIRGDLYPLLSEELRNDEEIFWAAYESCTCDDDDLYECAGTELKCNKEFILRIMEKTGSPFWILYSECLKEDKEAVYKALEEAEPNEILAWIEEIDDKFKYDREFILEAVKKDGEVLEWASDELKNDREVVIEAVCNEEYALEFASEELQNDETIMAEVLIRKAEEKRKLEEQTDKAKKLYTSYENQVDNKGQTQSDEE